MSDMFATSVTNWQQVVRIATNEKQLTDHKSA